MPPSLHPRSLTRWLVAQSHRWLFQVVLATHELKPGTFQPLAVGILTDANTEPLVAGGASLSSFVLWCDPHPPFPASWCDKVLASAPDFLAPGLALALVRVALVPSYRNWRLETTVWALGPLKAARPFVWTDRQIRVLQENIRSSY